MTGEGPGAIRNQPRGGRRALFLILFTALALQVASACTHRPTAAAADPEAGPAETPFQRMVGIAAAVRSASPQVARIWPGYWPPGQPFLLYTPESGALLVSDLPPPPEFVPVDSPAVPPILRGRAWFRAGSLPVNRPFVLEYPLGAGQSAVLAVVQGETDVANLLFHEQFHGFQQGRFRTLGGSQFVSPAAIADRVAFAAAAEVERRVLLAALRERTPEGRSNLLRQYLALRRQRLRELPDAVARVERQFERLEGTAKYIDRRAAVAMRGGSLVGLLGEVLSEDLNANGQPFLTAWFRGRGYGTGAALSYLLDQLDPAGWRQAVEHGAFLDERLAAALPPIAAGEEDALADAARARFGFEAVRVAMAPLIRAAEAQEIKSEAEFYALGAYRLVFELDSPVVGGRSDVSVGFASGPRGMFLLAEQTLVLPDAGIVNVSGPAVALTARNRPFMSSREGILSRYVVLLAAAPAANGGPMPPPGRHSLPRLDLTAPGLELAVQRPVSLSVTADGVTIRLE